MSESLFTRGWTLQELLLARKIRFYGKNWSPICPTVVEGRREERAARESREDQHINDKDNEAVIAAVTRATGIPEADIRSFSPSCTRVAEKMRWAAQRTTSRIEDVAYFAPRALRRYYTDRLWRGCARVLQTREHDRGAVHRPGLFCLDG